MHSYMNATYEYAVTMQIVAYQVTTSPILAFGKNCGLFNTYKFHTKTDIRQAIASPVKPITVVATVQDLKVSRGVCSKY